MVEITLKEYEKIFYENLKSGKTEKEIYKINFIKCEKCEKGHYLYHHLMVLLSYPSQKDIMCDECGDKTRIHIFNCP